MDDWFWAFTTVVILGGYALAAWISSRKLAIQQARERHEQRMALEKLQHQNRLELAARVDTTIHVLVADAALASAFESRLDKAMTEAGIPKVRVELAPDEEAEEVEEEPARKPKRRGRKSSRPPA